jgi:hypothetical protein
MTDLQFKTIYPGWNRASAEADAAAHPEKIAGVGGGTSGDSILQNAINSFLPMFKKVTPYEERNPFFFDEKLARTASEAEYSPYYKELLSDYTSTVERKKSRSREDLLTTLEQLNAGKEYYMGAERRALDKAERQTNEGYAGRGLFLSGVRKRDIADIREESANRTGNYLRNYDYNVGQARTSEKRSGEDLTTMLSQYTRDTERDKKYAIESSVLTKRGEALDEYNIKKKNYYANEYGTYA